MSCHCSILAAPAAVTSADRAPVARCPVPAEQAVLSELADHRCLTQLGASPKFRCAPRRRCRAGVRRAAAVLTAGGSASACAEARNRAAGHRRTRRSRRAVRRLGLGPRVSGSRRNCRSARGAVLTSFTELTINGGETVPRGLSGHKVRRPRKTAVTLRTVTRCAQETEGSEPKKLARARVPPPRRRDVRRSAHMATTTPDTTRSRASGVSPARSTGCHGRIPHQAGHGAGRRVDSRRLEITIASSGRPDLTLTTRSTCPQARSATLPGGT